MHRTFDLIIEKLNYLLNNFSEHCEKYGGDGNGNCNGKSCSDCVLKHAIEIITQIASEYSDGWIPISSGKLPEESGYYLVTYHDWSDGNYLPKYDEKRVKIMHYQLKDLSTGYSGWNYPKTIGKNADLIEKDRHKEVIAWKPLPELYKMENEK